MIVAYYEDLERLAASGCQVPGCTHEHDHKLVLNARCHPRAGTDLKLVDGGLHVCCAECGAFVIAIAVARREERQ